MINWKPLFESHILRRAQIYANEDRVFDIVRLGNGYSGKVNGNYEYTVRIRTDGDNVTSMSCNCPYALEGGHCKHMAALLYTVEEEEKTSGYFTNHFNKNMHEKKLPAANIQRPSRVYPFIKQREGKYRYYDFTKITADIVIKDNLYQRAMMLLEGNSGTRIHLSYGYTHEKQEGYCAIGRGYFKNTMYMSEVIITKNEIVSTNCPACHKYTYDLFGYLREEALCEHLLAILLAMDKQFDVVEEGDDTNYLGSQFMRGMLQRGNAAISPSEGKELIIQMKLEKKDRQLSLSFKIGEERLYVLRNLEELVSKYWNKEKIQFGKNTEFNFKTDHFNTESQAIFNIINQSVEEENLRSTYLYEYSYGIRKQNQSIFLFGSKLDEFYEMLTADGVIFEDKDERHIGLLKKGEGFPHFKLKIKKEIDLDNVFQGICIQMDELALFKGARGNYAIMNDCIYQLDKELYKSIEPLFSAIEQGEEMRIGRRRLGEFYHQVLPVLEKYCEIEDKDAEFISDYLPETPEFTFYLDAVDHVPVCRVEARYGEKSYFCYPKAEPQDIEKRIRSKEQNIINVVEEYFPRSDIKEGFFFCEDDELEIFRLLEHGIQTLMQLGEVQTTDQFQKLRIRRKTIVRLGVSVESNIMNLEIFSEDLSQSELLDVLNSYRQKKKYHRLKNGEFVPLDDTIAELSEMIQSMHITDREFLKGKMNLPAYRALYLDSMIESTEEIYANRDRKFKNLVRSFKSVKDSDFEVPDSLKKTLRPYQVYGYRWLLTLKNNGFGGILADDMGLGKTLQVISVLLNAKECGEEGTSIIVTPASLVYNWRAEFEQFAPSLKVGLVSGSQMEREEVITAWQKYDVLVTSYDLLKRDIALYEGITFAIQVIDEAQQIKNHATIAAKAVKVIQSKTKLALTGTPIENRLSELWSIFDYLMPGYLYGYDTFRKEIETPIVKKKDEEAMKRLKRMVSPFILRRLKQDVLKDLPDKIEKVQYSGFDTQQRHLYDAQVAKMKEKLTNADEAAYRKNKIEILAELMKIRQICCDPNLLFDNYQGESAKLETCLELVQSAISGEHKVLIFSQFTSMLEILKNRLDELQIAYYEITGSTPKKARVDLVNRFNIDQVPVFLISLKAGGTGLNLVGADIVIHYDPWWNVAAQNQATDRAHRIGQTKTVSVYKLIAKDTIEENILEMQLTKKEMADAILDGETGQFAEMSKEELLRLLGS